MRTSRICNFDFLASNLDHGLLLGLGDDDHTQYLLADGSRALGGDWSLGDFNLTEVGNITGSDVDISAGTGDFLTSGGVQAGAVDIVNNANTTVLTFTNSFGTPVQATWTLFTGGDSTFATDGGDFDFSGGSITSGDITIEDATPVFTITNTSPGVPVTATWTLDAFGDSTFETETGVFNFSGGSITAGAIIGTSFTDGVLSINAGSITSAVNGTFSGTGTFGQIIDNGLTASKVVFTDGSKQLTSTAITSGDGVYWNRTGTVLSPITAGDEITANQFNAPTNGEGYRLTEGTQNWRISKEASGDHLVIQDSSDSGSTFNPKFKLIFGDAGGAEFHGSFAGTVPIKQFFRRASGGISGSLFSVYSTDTDTEVSTEHAQINFFGLIGPPPSTRYIGIDILGASPPTVGGATFKVGDDKVAINSAGTAAPLYPLSVNGVARLGDVATNYTAFAANGTQTMVGTARAKKHLQGIVISGRGANAPTSRITEAPYLSWTFAVSDDTHETQIIPKDMDVTAAADIIVSWYTTDATADGVDSVNWQAQWSSEAVGELVTAGSTTDTSGDVLCGAQYAIVDTIVETIPANSIAQDDHLGLDITRIALTAGTDPSPTATSIHLISIEIEYTCNKLGEAL